MANTDLADDLGLEIVVSHALAPTATDEDELNIWRPELARMRDEVKPDTVILCNSLGNSCVNMLRLFRDLGYMPPVTAMITCGLVEVCSCWNRFRSS